MARLSHHQNWTRPDGRKKAQAAQKTPLTRGSVFALSAPLCGYKFPRETR